MCIRDRTWREEQGSFCKYDNPQKLLEMLSDFTDYNSDLSDLAAELKDTPTKLTIVYSPVYDEYLEQIARSFMSLGCLLYTSLKNVFWGLSWTIERKLRDK